MNKMLGMCFNRNVLIGLAAVGLGLFLFAPNLALAALPFLLLAACPLSMVLMPLLMGRERQHVMSRPGEDSRRLPEPTASGNGDSEERLLELVKQLQEQQAAVANQIKTLEQRIRSGPAQHIPEAHELPPEAELKEQHEVEIAKAR